MAGYKVATKPNYESNLNRKEIMEKIAIKDTIVFRDLLSRLDKLEAQIDSLLKEVE